MKIGRVIGASVIVAIAIPTAVGIALASHSPGGLLGSGSPGSNANAASAGSGPCGEPASPPKHYIGFITQKFPYNLKEWNNLGRLTGEHPDLGVYFTSFGAPFNAGLACHVERMGALPLLQINLRRASVPSIVAGKYRSYLTRFANAVKGMKARVAISIGHEMNGSWYPWGWQHVAPATFVRAWRTIHDAFTRAGAKNVIWVWTVNRPFAPLSVNPDPWWPGAAYVNWVGIDAHYVNPTDSFASVYGHTIREVRRVTTDPILIAETAIKPGPDQPRQLANLYHSTFTSPGMLGFVWFNKKSRFDWKLERQRKTLAEFRREARRYPT